MDMACKRGNRECLVSLVSFVPHYNQWAEFFEFRIYFISIFFLVSMMCIDPVFQFQEDNTRLIASFLFNLLFFLPETFRKLLLVRILKMLLEHCPYWCALENLKIMFLNGLLELGSKEFYISEFYVRLYQVCLSFDYLVIRKYIFFS